MAVPFDPTENAHVGAKFGRNSVPSLLVVPDISDGQPYPLHQNAGKLSVQDALAETTLGAIEADTSSIASTTSNIATQLAGVETTLQDIDSKITSKDDILQDIDTQVTTIKTEVANNGTTEAAILTAVTTGTVKVQDASAETSLTAIKNSVAGTLTVQDTSAETSLASIKTAVTGTLAVQDSAAETSLASIKTAVTGTLAVQDTSAETSLASIKTAVTGTLAVQDSTAETKLTQLVTASATAPADSNGAIVSVTTTITALVAANTARQCLSIQNQSTTNNIGVSTSSSATYATCPIVLQPGQSCTLLTAGGSQLAWYGIASGATCAVGIVGPY